MSLADIKSQMKAHVHEHMKYECTYGVAPDFTVSYENLAVRIHRDGSLPLFSRALGGTYGDSYAGKSEEQTILVFDAEDVVPNRGDVVVYSPTEGYKIDFVEPLREGYYSCPAITIDSTEIAEVVALIEGATP